MPAKLIINADDFGMCHSYNQAIFDLLEDERITSSTLMPVTPGREEAASWCSNHNTKNVGLHTTFTSEWGTYRWRSLTRLPSLEDEAGFQPPDVLPFLTRAEAAEVALELEAQFRWFESTGIFLSHADNHMGTLYPIKHLYPDASQLPDFLPMALDACKRHGGVPFRMFRKNFWTDFQMIPAELVASDVAYGAALNIAMVDNLYSYPFAPLPGETYESFRTAICTLLRSLPEGVHEIYFHPSADTAEVREICGSWQRRIWEYRLLMDDELHYALRDAGVELITYRNMQQLRKRI